MRYPTMVRLFFFLSILSTTILAQTSSSSSCLNFASPSTTLAGSCDCPPGLGGPTCSSLACGNPLMAPASRPVFNTTLSGSNGSNGCGNQCSTGFTGPTCSVCTSSSSCASAITGVGKTPSSDVYCSSGAWSWTESFVSCSVINPTLQSVFPGSTYLTIQKTIDPDASLSAPYAANGTGQMQLFYSPASGNTTMAEQFYCSASACAQSNTTTTTQNAVNWDCTNIQCSCIPGTEFCGGGNLDLTETIAGINTKLSISCSADGKTCSFKQATLNNLFGINGLSLTGCSFGECVSAGTVNTLSSQLVTNPTLSEGLSGGVIGGLAVLGVVVAALIMLYVIGWLNQRKARKEVLTKPASIESKEGGGGVGLRWKGIGYALPSKGSSYYRRVFFGPGSTTHLEDGKVILDGVSGQVLPGQLCAILGPTGAGKSTLVDILAGKRKSGKISGSVDLVGPDGAVLKEKVTVGYVDQMDILPGMSTVREALMFAAELKLGETVSRQEKSERVFEVLSWLKLVDVADSLIGAGDGRGRGISGGERRRVSIGLELVAAPAILVLDEPTSGLDSVSALRVVQVLKALTNNVSGRSTTVLATIHQPNSQVFHMFDSIVTLATGGRQVYYGPAVNVVEHFKSQGLMVPDKYNPADYLLEIASNPPASLLPPPTTLSAPTSPDPNNARIGSRRSSKFDIFQDQVQPIAHQTKPVTVILTQFEVLAERELLNFKRDWTLVIMHTVVAIIVGLFVGGLYYKTGVTIAGFQNRIGSLFFLGSLLMFSSLSALSNFTHVKPLFLRERGALYYSPISWFLSRVVFDIVPLRIFPTILVATIIYWMVGLAPTAAHFFKYLLIVIEFSIAATLWNLFLAAAIAEGGTAILISSVLNLFQMAFAGFFVNLASIPGALRWLQYIAPLKYCLEALSVNEVSSGLLIKDNLQGVAIQISATLIMETLFGFKESAYYRDVLVLFAFIAGFAILVVLAVISRLRELR